MFKQDSQLEKLTQAIDKLIANPVAPVLPIAPVAPVLPIAPQKFEDHELILRVDEKLIGVIKKVDDISLKLDTKYITAEEHDTVVNIIKDHEKRIRSIEKYAWAAIGGLYLINIVIGFYIALKK